MKLPLSANEGPACAWLEDAEFNHVADYLTIENAQTIAHRVNCFEELRDALEILASIPLEEFGLEKRKDSQSIMGWNNVNLTVGHVRAARAALERAKQ